MLADMFSRLLHNNTHAHTTTTTTTTTTITTSSPLSQNAFSSPPSPPPAHPDSDPDTDFTMKDLSNAQSRASNRNTAYPKKRPSPVVRDGGVAKRKSGSPITAASVIAGLSRRLQDEEAASRRLAALQQHNLQKLLESEYRNDVLKYMHEMEVGLAVSCTHPAWSGRSISPLYFFRAQRCLLPRPWISNPRFAGRCVRASSTSLSSAICLSAFVLRFST